MTAPLKVRMLAIPLVWVPALLGSWIYISTHDFAHTWRQIQLGHPPTFPPRAKDGPRPESLDAAQHALGTTLHVRRDCGAANGGRWRRGDR